MDDLIHQAKEAAENSNVQYSAKSRGAVLLTNDGQVYHGCDIIIKNLPNSFHAEEVAMVEALKNNHSHFEKLAATSVPCGRCLQLLTEFCDSELKIVYIDGDEDVVESTLGQLLPHP